MAAAATSAAPPPKPWAAAAASSTTATSAPGQPKPWEQPGGANSSLSTELTPRPSERPWERDSSQLGTSGLGTSTSYLNRPGAYGTGSSLYNSGYNSNYGSMYNSGYGSGMYGSGSMYGGGYGSSYMNRGLYGGGMYGSGMYGGGMYGSGGMYGNSMYGGGMYGGGVGGPMYGGMGGPPNPMDPNNPQPAAPPSAWQALVAGINGVMHFFGRLSFLVDENAHAVHFFISALLQLLDRAGYLYAELARFIIRILFRWRRNSKANAAAAATAVGATGPPPGWPGAKPQGSSTHVAPSTPSASLTNGVTSQGRGFLEQAACDEVPGWGGTAAGSGSSATPALAPAVPAAPAGSSGGAPATRALPRAPTSRSPAPSSTGPGWEKLWGN